MDTLFVLPSTVENDIFICGRGRRCPASGPAGFIRLTDFLPELGCARTYCVSNPTQNPHQIWRKPKLGSFLLNKSKSFTIIDNSTYIVNSPQQTIVLSALQHTHSRSSAAVGKYGYPLLLWYHSCCVLLLLLGVSAGV